MVLRIPSNGSTSILTNSVIYPGAINTNHENFVTGIVVTGSVLIPMLLEDGHEIISIDTQWFGNHLPTHPQLTNIKCDIRDTDSIPLDNVDSIIHLANIANDPAVELNPTLSWEVNVLAGQQLADKAVRAGVKQFIFASSGSVYGVKDEPKVTEDLSLVPISVYNKTKMVAERVFLSYSDKMQVHCVRPATVCGHRLACTRRKCEYVELSGSLKWQSYCLWRFSNQTKYSYQGYCQCLSPPPGAS